MNNTPAPRPTPEERARAVMLYLNFNPPWMEVDATRAEIAAAIRQAVEDATADLNAELSKCRSVVSSLADRIVAQSETLTAEAERSTLTASKVVAFVEGLATVIGGFNDACADGDRGRGHLAICLTIYEDARGSLGQRSSVGVEDWYCFDDPRGLVDLLVGCHAIEEVKSERS